jgi:hypothetical protein
MTRKPVRGTSHYANGTWIEPEELAYNTYSGTHWGSGRRAAALCNDGKVRIIRIGIPSMWFAIPGHDSRGNTGAITMDETETGEPFVTFTC